MEPMQVTPKEILDLAKHSTRKGFVLGVLFSLGVSYFLEAKEVRRKVEGS